uniref:Uncharacterized protein n=1 Tax=Trichogramma kaykai TaxID=54128 RepID=A0ABD2WHN7_9HYME
MAKWSIESAVVGEYEATENQELRNPLTLDQDQGETSVEVEPLKSLCEKQTHKKILREGVAAEDTEQKGVLKKSSIVEKKIPKLGEILV